MKSRIKKTNKIEISACANNYIIKYWLDKVYASRKKLY